MSTHGCWPRFSWTIRRICLRQRRRNHPAVQHPTGRVGVTHVTRAGRTEAVAEGAWSPTELSAFRSMRWRGNGDSATRLAPGDRRKRSFP